MENLKLVVGEYASQLDEQHPNSRVFKTNIKSLKVGDFCIAESAKGMIVVRIARIVKNASELPDGSFNEGIKEANWIIKKVSVDTYFDKKAKRERLKEVMTLLDNKYEAVDINIKYKLYATIDEEFKTLLDEYNSLLV